MTMFVSIASIAALRSSAERLLDVLVAQALAVMRERSENLLGLSGNERPGRPQEHPLSRLFDDEFFAGAPPPAVADSLRQDDLPFGRDNGRRLFR
jgi:hypothetical protein